MAPYRSYRALASWLLTAGLLVGMASGALADVPRELAFQGRLAGPDGKPLTGDQAAAFRLYDASGTLRWEGQRTLSLSPAGLFSTQLGPFSDAIPFDNQYSVQILVAGQTFQQPLSASPYSFRAHAVDGLTVKDGSVGIGTTTPTAGTLVVSANNYPQVVLNSANSNGANLIFQEGGATDGRIGHLTATDKLQFAHGSALSADMTIDTTGNVGIGTTDPKAKLEVGGALRLAPAGAPASPAPGTIYFDGAHFFGYTGTAWEQLDN